MDLALHIVIVAMLLVIGSVSLFPTAITSLFARTQAGRSRKPLAEDELRDMVQALIGNAEGVFFCLVVSDEDGHIKGLSRVLESKDLSTAEQEAETLFRKLLESIGTQTELSYDIWRIGD